MMVCQLANLKSIREVVLVLASCESPQKQLGLSETVKRSTLSYANAHRPWEILAQELKAHYETIFHELLKKCQAEVAAKGGRRKFRFKNKLVSLDGSIIDLSVTMYDWAKYRQTNGARVESALGAIKLHLLLDHNGYLPSFAVVTEGKMRFKLLRQRSELEIARSLKLDPGTILVIDQCALNSCASGYNDYEWFLEMTMDGVYFVTRMKTNCVYKVEEECEVPEKGNVMRDQIISLPALSKAGEEPALFRRIEYWNEEKSEILVFFTNILHLAASTIAKIFKERWQIELFFKALKQNLKVKTFLGTSVNAVKTQIWTALIAMLILKYLQMKSTYGWSLSNLAALLRTQLFIYRDLWAWLNSPMDGPPAARQLNEQLAMPLVW